MAKEFIITQPETAPASNVIFYAGFNHWVNEYPDARVFDSLEAAAKVANKLDKRTRIVADYGLDTEMVIRWY